MAEGDIRTLVVDDSEFFADMTAETLTQEHGMGAVAVYSGADAVERLTEEEFASVVSHDLHNPLNVATSALELLDAEDDDLVEKIDRSLDRMGDIIEDVLTLAREGRAVDEPEWVAIESLAEVAWADVETEGATLSVPATGEMVADPTRARDLFANRFRNAVEHNDGPVTVTVGALEDGFYVADDGTVLA